MNYWMDAIVGTWRKCEICGCALQNGKRKYCDKCNPYKRKSTTECILCGNVLPYRHKKYCLTWECLSIITGISCNRIKRLYLLGMSSADIARIANVDYEIIRLYLYRLIGNRPWQLNHVGKYGAILQKYGFTYTEIDDWFYRERNTIIKYSKCNISKYNVGKLEKYKRCGTCRLLRPVEMYGSDKNTFDGYSHQCKKCRHERTIKDRKRARQYFIDNKDSLYAQRRITERERLKSDPLFKMKSRMRILLHRVIKKCGGDTKIKNGRKSEEIFGWTIGEFCNHIELLWQNGMTWDNYGMGKNTWQIDHVKPVAAFDENDMIDFDSDGFAQCWALDNLQPMWSDENIAKSDIYAGEYNNDIQTIRITMV